MAQGARQSAYDLISPLTDIKISFLKYQLCPPFGALCSAAIPRLIFFLLLTYFFKNPYKKDQDSREQLSTTTYVLGSVQDFLIKVGMKPCMHLESSLFSLSINFLTVSCQKIGHLICLALQVSRCFFQNNRLYWHFLYCSGFNLWKKSCRKNKYLQSTVE